MHDAARAKVGDEECEQRAEQGIMELQKIAGPDLPGVVPEEGSPALSTRSLWANLTDVAPNRPLGHLDVEFQQLALDALDAPQAVVAGHLVDQRNRLGRNPWRT